MPSKWTQDDLAIINQSSKWSDEDTALLGKSPHAAVAQPMQQPAPRNLADPSQVNSFGGAVGLMGEQFGQGALASVHRTYLGLKQAATYLTGDSAAKQAINDEIAQMEQQYGPALSTPAGKIGNMAGVVGQFAVPGMIAGKVAQSMPGVANAVRAVTGAPGSIQRGAVTAGAFEAAQPVQTGNTSGEDQLIQRGMKGLAGAAVGGVAAGLANKLTRPGAQVV
jgi:hypothetical protein